MQRIFLNPMHQPYSSAFQSQEGEVEIIKKGKEKEILISLEKISRALSTLSGMNGYITQLPNLLSELQVLITNTKNKRIINETIQCLAYLFDYNPLLVTELKKTTMRILLKEGISNESTAIRNNSLQIASFLRDNKLALLLNDNWFYCIIELISNTTPEAQRKKMQSICYTIAAELKTYQEFKQYIQPGIMFIEKNIKNSSYPITELIQFFKLIEVIARHCKHYKAKEEKEGFTNGFFKSSNIIQLLYQFLSDITYKGNLTDHEVKSKAESDDIILIIINIFAIFSQVSKQIAEYIIKLDILTILNKLMMKDPQLLFSHKNAFQLLRHLFPHVNSVSKSKENQLSDLNKKEYDYFSNDILNVIQSIHYVKYSPPEVLNNIIRLLDMHFITSKKPRLQYNFAAQITSLVFSSKCYKYYCRAIEFIEHILSHSHDKFKTILLTEGVVNQLENIEYPSTDKAIKPQFTIASLFLNPLRPQVAKVEVSNEMITEIKAKLAKLLKTYKREFAEDKESKKRLEALIHIKNQLIILRDNDNIIIKAIDLLINEKQNPITQYEINKSQIIQGICDYFDKSINEIIKNDQYQTKPLQFKCDINTSISHKASIIVKHLLSNENKLTLFIQMLNNQLSAVNTFPLIEPIPPQGTKIGKFCLLYNKNVFENIQSEMENLGDFAKELTQYHINYSSIQKYYFEFEEKEKVAKLFEMLYYHSHVDIAQIDGDCCFIPKLVLYYDNNTEEEVVILKDQTFKEALLKIVIKQNIQQDKSEVWDLEIVLRFGLLYDIKDENNAIKMDKQSYKKQSQLFCSHSVNFNYLIASNDDITSIRQSEFELAYYNNVIFNKGIYINKEACPVLYLLSLVHYGIKCFNDGLKDISDTVIENNTITSLIIQQLSKAEVVIMSKIPKWMRLICSSINISSFDSRMLLFKLVFHISRTYPNFQSMIKTHFIQPSTQLSSRFISEIKKKYIIKAKRGNEVDSVKQIMGTKNIETYFGYIEFEFIDEIGNGQGPTLEFYSNLFIHWQRESDLWIKTSNGALYPKPCTGNEETFKQIGYMIGRAILDNRLFDFPLSSIFFDLVLGRPILIETISELDLQVGKVVRELMRIIEVKKAKNNSDNDLKQLLKYEGKTSIEDLGLSFVLPGYDNISLKPQGIETQVTIDNIEEYIRLIYKTLFVNASISNIKESFIKGFNMGFNYTHLSLFTSKELEEKICGSLEEKWDKSTLQTNIIPDHGYTKSSPVFNHLITFLSSLSKENQKKFLKFTTGTSRLPLGGFGNLNPKLTVVRRHTEHYDNPNCFLPSVMTCQNYLKLPEYSSYDILQAKITIAMNEGASEFHLS